MKKTTISVLTVILVAIAIVIVAKPKCERTNISENFAAVVEHTSKGIITDDSILYKGTLSDWKFFPGDKIRFIKSGDLPKVLETYSANKEPWIATTDISDPIKKVEKTEDKVFIETKYARIALRAQDYIIEFIEKGKPTYFYIGKCDNLKAYKIPM